MGLRRKENWPRLLLEAIEEKKHARFQPGTHDCCISTCDLIERMTGADIAIEFRGYSDRKGMEETLAEHGGVDGIAESVTTEYGLAEIPPSMAQRGDLLMLDFSEYKKDIPNAPDGAVFAIVDMDGIHAVACGYKGWTRVPIKACAKRAWRIG